MKGKQLLGIGLAIALMLTLMPGLVLAQEPAGIPLSAGFTYQGRLRIDNVPYTGLCDLEFSLWDEASVGNQIGTPQTVLNAVLADGFFTVLLDWGPDAFQGDHRFLEIHARCPAGSGPYTPLDPRQDLTPSPYALYAMRSPWAGLVNVPLGFADGIDNDTTYTAGTGLTLLETTFNANTEYLQQRVGGTCGSGFAIRSVNQDGSVNCEPVGGGGGDAWLLTGNSGTTPGVNYVGTNDNVALVFKVNGERALRLEPNFVSPNVIGGYIGNWAYSGVFGAAIGGGGNSTEANIVTDSYGIVGGGARNRAGNDAGTIDDAMYATVSGGWGNTASGWYATISGGGGNTAGLEATVSGGTMNTGSGIWATVGGGYNNTASGEEATIGGGWTNTASGEEATIGGGWSNTASGEGSTISGGIGNTASSTYATVGGGYGNIGVGYTTIGGGYYNAASEVDSTIGGGARNNATGQDSTIGGGSYNAVSATYGTIAGGGPIDQNNPSTTSNRVTDNYGTVGGGGNNQAGDAAGSTDDAEYATVCGGVSNEASGEYSTVGGGITNIASGYMSIIGGGSDNTALHYATVSGGYENIAAGNWSMIGGGQQNHASGFAASIGGGSQNSASDEEATVAGGQLNNASGIRATIGGGYTNTASGSESTVGGGQENVAGGIASTVPGGVLNVAQGNYSFAAGTRAKAYYTGCFVWGDSSDADITCDNADRWVARTSGGVYFYTSAGFTSGVYVAAGGSSWNSISDRATKENFFPADNQAILETLASLPLQEYNLKSQDDSIRHVGLVAQDFATFGYGESDKAINMEDADGVALAAIQALYAENQALKAENTSQQQQIDAFEARLAVLETTSHGTANPRTWQVGLLSSLGLLVVGLAWVAHRGGKAQ
jgi:hypothetical protein